MTTTDRELLEKLKDPALGDAAKFEREYDRKLLELAAKAAGLQDYDYVGGVGAGMREQAVHGVPHCGYTGPIWNPFTDDGDALRLAVKLEISIEPSGSSACAISRDQKVAVIETIGGDLLAATRRAIVRAAAEIGRAMQ